MREEEEKILAYGYLEVAHGRACVGTGRANFLEKEGWGVVKSGTAVPLQARAMPSFWTS